MKKNTIITLGVVGSNAKRKALLKTTKGKATLRPTYYRNSCLNPVREVTKLSRYAAASMLVKADTLDSRAVRHTHTISTISRETCALFPTSMKYFSLDMTRHVSQAIDKNGLFHYIQALSLVISAVRYAINISAGVSDDEIREKVVCNWSFYEYLHIKALATSTSVGPCRNCVGGLLVLNYDSKRGATIVCSQCNSNLIAPGNPESKKTWRIEQTIELLERLDVANGISKSVTVVKTSGENKQVHVETVFLVQEMGEPNAHAYDSGSGGIDIGPTSLVTILVPSTMGSKVRCFPLKFHNTKVSVCKRF